MSLPEDMREAAEAALANPGGWPMINFKAALSERLGAAAARGELARLLAPFGPRRGGTGAPGQLIDHVSPRIYAEAAEVPLAGAPLATGGRSPRVTLAGRALFLAELADARVFGRSAFIEAGGRLLADHQGDERTRMATRPWFDALVTGEEAGEMHWLLPENDALELDEAISLIGPFSPGWGHALLEFAPQLLLAAEMGLPPGVPMIVDAGLPEPFEALFRWVAPGRPLIRLGVGQAARVRRLWKASAPEYWPILRQPEVIFETRHSSMNPPALARLLATLPPPPPPSGERLFLARSGHPRLADQPGVAAVFERQGFTVLYPERLPLAEQLRRLRAADVVAGAAGSQLLQAQLYGRAGQLSLNLHNPELEETPALTATQEALGQTVLVLTGTPDAEAPGLPYNRPLHFEPAALENALEALHAHA
ncbi:glycosyltransferase 61 family protein [Pseudoroseicyclus sp. H15]